ELHCTALQRAGPETSGHHPGLTRERSAAPALSGIPAMMRWCFSRSTASTAIRSASPEIVRLCAFFFGPLKRSPAASFHRGRVRCGGCWRRDRTTARPEPPGRGRGSDEGLRVLALPLNDSPCTHVRASPPEACTADKFQRNIEISVFHGVFEPLSRLGMARFYFLNRCGWRCQAC